jgi:bifunctional non-homologous end joining protein LigD
MIVNGVTISHPEKLLWPGDGITKRRLVMHYDAVASWMLPYVLGRPVAMVRCPGASGICPQVCAGVRSPPTLFLSQASQPGLPGPFGRVTIEESDGPAPYLTITEPGSLNALAQMECWRSTCGDQRGPTSKHPDLLVFDLDPDPAVDWKMLADAARLVREVLLTLGLESFVKTTGGKGLHVQAPISPTEDWDTVRSFCKAVADVVVAHDPRRYTSQMAKAKRTGKIFIDYMRNNRGATSIAPYSTRAREHATVAVPLRWRELSGSVRPDAYTVGNIQARLSKLKGDPWEGYAEAGNSQGLAQAVQRVAGVGVPGQIWK